MKVTVTSIREKVGKYGNSLMFNLWFEELEFLSCGWRLSKGAILAPSYQVGGNYQSTFFAGREIQEAIYTGICGINLRSYSKIDPVLEFSDAVYSWAVNPDVLRRKAPEALTPKQESVSKPVLIEPTVTTEDEEEVLNRFEDGSYSDTNGNFHYGNGSYLDKAGKFHAAETQS